MYNSYPIVVFFSVFLFYVRLFLCGTWDFVWFSVCFGLKRLGGYLLVNILAEESRVVTCVGFVKVRNARVHIWKLYNSISDFLKNVGCFFFFENFKKELVLNLNEKWESGKHRLRTATKLCWDTHDTGHLPPFLDGGVHLDLADLDLGFAPLRRLLDLFRFLHFRLHGLHNFHVRHRDRLNFLLLL